MTVEKTVKVKLTNEEEQCLKKANEIINEMFNTTTNCNYSCKIEFEENIEDILDEMQSTIRYII